MRSLTTGAAGLALLASIAVAGTLAIAACGGSAGAAAATTPAPATSGTGSPPSASAAASAAPADRTLVSGTTDCNAVKETAIPGVERPVRISFDCTYRMSDPRVSGPQPMDCDEGFYDLADLPGGVGIWDTCSGVLEGQGGTWKGVAAYGSEFMKSGSLRVSGTQIYEGQGAFDGLRFVMHFSGSPELDRLYGEDYQVAGWIEPME